MSPEPCSGHGCDSGAATSETAGANDDCPGHVFRNPAQTFHGAHCERCGLSFLEWGRRRDAELADVVDWRHSD